MNNEKVARELVRIAKKLMVGAIHVSVDELPLGVKKALKAIRYNRRDIALTKGNSYSPSMASSYGDGYRGYLLVVDIHRGIKERMTGSWGGQNMFTKSTEDDTSKKPIPNNCVVIYGNEGARLSATILAPPDMIEEFEDEDDGQEGEWDDPIDLTDKEMAALNIIGGIKSGYRQDEFNRERLGLYGPGNPLIESLAKKGMVKITKRGVMITIVGRESWRWMLRIRRKN